MGLNFKQKIIVNRTSRKHFMNHLKAVSKVLQLTDKDFQKYLQEKVLQTVRLISEEKLVKGITNNDDEIDIYKENHKIRELENGFELYNDTQIPADKYNTIPFDTSGYPNGMFSVALAFEYGTGVVGISDYGVKNGYVYNDIGNTKSKSHRKFGDKWYLPVNVNGYSGVISSGYEGFEIYRYTAIEVENQIDNWTMDYLTNGKGGKK